MSTKMRVCDGTMVKGTLNSTYHNIKPLILMKICYLKLGMKGRIGRSVYYMKVCPKED